MPSSVQSFAGSIQLQDNHSIAIGNNVLSSTGSNFVINAGLQTTSLFSDIGSIAYPFKSIFVSTGSILIGPTGSIEINPNGLISSPLGFASSFYQVGNLSPGNGILLYQQQDKLFYQNQFGASGPVSVFNVQPNNINNYFFTGGNIGFNTNAPNYLLDVNGTGHFVNLIVDNITGALNGLPTIRGATGPTGASLTGPTGYTGPQGIPGATGPVGSAGGPSLTLYMDSTTRSYTGSPLISSLHFLPTQTTQTTITTGNHSNTTLLISSFITSTGAMFYPYVHEGIWEMHLYAIANTNNAVSFYFNAGYIDEDGVSNKVIFATGSESNDTLIPNVEAMYGNSLYVSDVSLPDLTKRIVVDLYMKFTGNNRNATLYFRNGTLSHIHTTLQTSSSISPFSLTGTNNYYNTSSLFGYGLDYPTQTIDVRGSLQVFGSSGAADPLIIKSNNAHGGVGYAGLLTLTNSITGTSNPNKFVRMDNAGSLEIINSGYTGTLLSLNDSGDLNVQGSVYGTPNYTTAGLGSDQSMTASDTVIQFTVISDPNSWWKTTGSPAYRFQPTRSGVYVISFSALWTVGSGTGQINTQIAKNGNQVLLTQSQVNINQPQTHSNTAIVSLNGSSDYITITGYSSSSSSQSLSGGPGKTQTTFNAYLLN